MSPRQPRSENGSQQTQQNPVIGNWSFLILQIIFALCNLWIGVDIVSRGAWDKWLLLLLCTALVPFGFYLSYMSIMAILAKPRLSETDYIESDDAKFYRIAFSPTLGITHIIQNLLVLVISFFVWNLVDSKLGLKSSTLSMLGFLATFMIIWWLVSFIFQTAYIRMRPFKSRFQCPSCNWPVLTEDCYTCISCGSISNPFLCNSTCPVCHHAEKSIICGRCRGSFPIDEWHEKSKWGEIGQIYDQLTSLSSLLKEKNLRTYDKMLQSYFKQMPDLKRKIDSARQAIARFNKAEIVEEITQTTARLEDTHANGATTVLQEKLKILKSTFERIQKLAETLEIYQLKQESFVAELKNLELRIIQDDLVTEEEIISLSKTIEDINNVFDVMDKTKTSYAKFCS